MVYNLPICNVSTYQNEDWDNHCINDKPETKYHFGDPNEVETDQN